MASDLLEELEERLDIELKIKDGAENLLSVFETGAHAGLSSSASSSGGGAGGMEGKEALRRQVEIELENARGKIATLQRQIMELRGRSASPTPSTVASESTSGYGQVYGHGGTSALGLQSPRGGILHLGHLQTAGSEYGGTSNGATGSPRSIPNAVPISGGLGIGCESSPSSTGGIVDHENLIEGGALVDEELVEGGHVARSHAFALMQTLHTLSAPPRSVPLSPKAELETVPHSPPANGQAASPMGPPVTPSMTRSAQRARAAALAKGETGHVRTPSHVRGLGDQPRARLATLSQLAGLLQRNLRLRYEIVPDELVACVFPCLSDGAGKEVRGAAYRVLRYALVRPPWPLIARCRARGLDVYLTHTFLRDARFDTEREQALKLVRAIMEAGADPQLGQAARDEADGAHDLISVGVVRALVAAADHSSDKLRHLCLETLVELAVHDVDVLVRGGGLRTVLHAITEGPPELAPVIVQSLLLLVDMPTTRAYFKPGSDIEVALSGFTDSPAMTGIAYDETLRSTANVVLVMLRSWSGLLYLCINGRHSIASIVLALRVNSNDVRKAILAMLHDVFTISTAATATPVMANGVHSAFQRFPSTGAQRDQSNDTSCRLNLLDQYLALLLVIFFEAGLADAVIHVLESAPELTRDAAQLMGQVMLVANRVLPRSYGVRVHAFANLFRRASRFERPNGEERQRATTALSAIASQTRQHFQQQQSHHTSHSSNETPAATRRERSDSTEDPMRRGQRQVEKAKLRQNMQIDDTDFRNRLIETQMLNTRDHTRWQYDKLIELLEGPLMNPRRLEEAMRGSKFMRRLLAFFQPMSLRFALVPRTPANMRYVRLGCVTLNTLLSCPDGVRFLGESKILRELRECFEHLLPHAGGLAGGEPIMSRSRISETLTWGYFEMLGVLTRSNDGLALMERASLFTSLYALSELRSRDDLMRLVVERFDFSIEGHTRIVLSKVLTSTYSPMRLFATQHLASLIRKTPQPGHWMIRLLLTQLYDPSNEVREVAACIVKEVCTSVSVLETVVSMRPALEHLGETGHPLLLKFVSTPLGLRYLLQGGYIEREMDDWFHHRNHRYTVQLEVLLARAFSIHRTRDDPRLRDEFDGTVPAHFYGELVKTKEGCDVLERKGHFAEFARFVRQHGHESHDVEVITKLKSVLWAVGNIGCTPGGCSFLEAEDIVSVIVDIAERSQVLSVKGTCFFVIGLISGTQQGAELLHDYGWLSATSTLGVPLSLCIPADVESFVAIQKWDVTSSAHLRYLELAEPEGSIEQTIMLCVANLGNSIQAHKASRALAKLKARHRQAFDDPSLFCRALELLESHHYRQPVRKYIWDLFDVRLNEASVAQLGAIRKRLVERKRAGQASRDASRARHVRTTSSDAGPPPVRRPTNFMRGVGSMGTLLREGRLGDDEAAAEAGMDEEDAEGFASHASVSIDDDEDHLEGDDGEDEQVDDHALHLGPGAPKGTSSNLPRLAPPPKRRMLGGFGGGESTSLAEARQNLTRLAELDPIRRESILAR